MHSYELTSITGDAATTAFVIHDAFEPALLRIRQAIHDGGLYVAAEIDAAHRLKRSLQISVSPCRVLLVDSPLFMLQATAIHRASAVLIPLHLVVSGAEEHTTAHMLSLECIRLSGLPIGIRAPLLQLRRELFGILSTVADSIGSRQNISEPIPLR